MNTSFIKHYIDFKNAALENEKIAHLAKNQEYSSKNPFSLSINSDFIFLHLFITLNTSYNTFIQRSSFHLHCCDVTFIFQIVLPLFQNWPVQIKSDCFCSVCLSVCLSICLSVTGWRSLCVFLRCGRSSTLCLQEAPSLLSTPLASTCTCLEAATPQN